MKLIKRCMIALALATTAVATTGCDVGKPVSVSNTTVDDKAVYVAEATYNEVAKAYLKLVGNKQLTGAKKEAAKQALLDAYSYLGKMKIADDFLNSKKSFNASIAKVRSFIT